MCILCAFYVHFIDIDLEIIYNNCIPNKKGEYCYGKYQCDYSYG